MHIAVPGPPLVRLEPICTNSAVPMVPKVGIEKVFNNSVVISEGLGFTSNSNELDVTILYFQKLYETERTRQGSHLHTFNVLCV